MQHAGSKSTSGKPYKIYQIWDDGYIIRSMTRDDAKLVQKWFHDLLPCSRDLEFALDSDIHGGYFIGEYKEEMISSYVYTKVAEGLAYSSYYYVIDKYKHMRFGKRINEFAIKHLRRETILAGDSVYYLVLMNMQLGSSEHFGISTYMGKVPTSWDLEGLPHTTQVK